MKPHVALTVFAMCPGLVHAASTASVTYPVNTQIPDNSSIGLASTHLVTTSITTITGVEVRLEMNGGWSGDLYAYLTHDGGFAVLLNRPGRSFDEPAGSGAADLAITLTDNAVADIHAGIAASGAVAGFFQPDGRHIDPDLSLDTSARTAFLSTFDGLDANGDWTLFVADVAAGETMTLDSWSLTITGVPEPAAGLLVLATGCLALRRSRSRGR